VCVRVCVCVCVFVCVCVNGARRVLTDLAAKLLLRVVSSYGHRLCVCACMCGAHRVVTGFAADTTSGGIKLWPQVVGCVRACTCVCVCVC